MSPNPTLGADSGPAYRLRRDKALSIGGDWGMDWRIMATQLAMSLLLTAPCVVLHAGGLLLIVYRLQHRFPRLLDRFNFLRSIRLLVGVFAVILALHVTEIALWSVFYVVQGCFGDFETALYYSFSAYTSVGYGDLVLPKAWRLVGSLETCVGFLLFGWSTAFSWALVARLLAERERRHAAGHERIV